MTPREARSALTYGSEPLLDITTCNAISKVGKLKKENNEALKLGCPVSAGGLKA
jgi:hypothetical protein